MRLILHADVSGRELADDALTDLYAFDSGPVLRANFVSTLDGAANGSDGLSGSINDAVDRQVFALQRRLCDAVLVGAGTAQVEGYRRAELVDGRAPTIVALSNHARVPDGLIARSEGWGEAILVTCESAGAAAIAAAREVLSHNDVWVIGETEVDLPALLARLRAIGLDHVLCEGGPTLFSALLAQGLVDEVALTRVGTLVGGTHPRIAHGPAFDLRLSPKHLIEEDGTLLGLWIVTTSG